LVYAELNGDGINAGDFLTTGKFVSHVTGFATLFGVGIMKGRLGLVCLACGLQNEAITSSPSQSVRTTHLTGLTTDLGLGDLGLGLARVFTFDLKSARLQKEVLANYLRIGPIVSFIIGSAVGAWFFIDLDLVDF
jgi:uncharacterized membrane protein YoaK (UPF0700 family)